MAVGRLPSPVPSGPGVRRDDPKLIESFVLSIVRPLPLLRAARVAVAIERYRRDHAEQGPDTADSLVPAYLSALPIDPFSGQPMRLRKEAGGYAVYSVGSNRRDDGGNFTEAWLPGGGQEGPDTGIRIQYRTALGAL